VLIRVMLAQRAMARIGRVVCLGTPFRGSVSGARLARWPGGRHVVGKCIADLAACGGFDSWGQTPEVGIIAGSVPLGGGRLLGRLDEPNDGTVTVAETRLRDARDHLVLPVTHMSLLWSAVVAAQAAHFFAHGRFARP
jgi:hypothetical protein